MIVARLMGGLGNQMFQYAAARNLATLRGTKLALDLGWFDDEGARAPAPRTYELDALHLQLPLVRVSQRRLEVLEGFAPRLLTPLRWFPPRLTVVREKSPSFDPSLFAAPESSLLIGYWQSERYFDAVAEQVRAQFSFDRSDGVAEPTILGEIEASPSLGVHVRRGDYVTSATTNLMHGTLDPTYYDEAVNYVSARRDVQRIFVFSDDPDWAEAHLSFALPTTYLRTEGRAVDDLHLLQMCNHQVIANSSFSWWAAWLNNNPEKIVVAPKQWFRDPGIATHDLIPSAWHRL
jgi:hypothetical protein